ncbi:MAG: hypothetical protein ACK40H_01345 [Sphingomonadaceae bacterium]
MAARLRLAALAAGACLAAPAAALAQQQPAGVQPGAAPLEAIVNDPQAPPRTRGVEFFAEVRQSLDIDELFDGDLRTFTILQGGANAFVARERLRGSLSYQGTLRVVEAGNGNDRFDNNLIASGEAELLRDTLFLEGRAFASLLAGDQARGIPFLPEEEDDNLRQVYVVTPGARVQRRLGDFVQVTARASYSWVRTNDASRGGGFGGAGGAGRFGSFGDSTGYQASGSIAGIPRGRLTWAVNGSLVANDQNILDQKYRSKSGTLELGYAASRNLQLVGSVGYEEYESTRQAILQGPRYLRAPFAVSPDPNNPDVFFIPGSTPPQRVGLPGGTFIVQGPPPGVGVLPDPINFLINPVFATSLLSDPLLVLIGGAPVQIGFGNVVDANGNFVPDPSGLRETLFADSGLVWNAGFRWEPSPRTTLELRAGQRFGDVVVTGQLVHRLTSTITVYGRLTDGIQNFGTILTQIIDGVPVSFAQGGGGRFRGQLGGCVIGPDPTDPTLCIDGQTQSITTGIFRSRIGTIGIRADRGRAAWNINLTHNVREYLDEGASLAPGAPIIDPTLADRYDITTRLDAQYSYILRPGERVSFGAFVSRADLALREARNDWFLGANGRYERRLTERLSAVGSLTVIKRISDQRRDTLNSLASAGLRYNF